MKRAWVEVAFVARGTECRGKVWEERGPQRRASPTSRRREAARALRSWARAQSPRRAPARPQPLPRPPLRLRRPRARTRGLPCASPPFATCRMVRRQQLRHGVGGEEEGRGGEAAPRSGGGAAAGGGGERGAGPGESPGGRTLPLRFSPRLAACYRPLQPVRCSLPGRPGTSPTKRVFLLLYTHPPHPQNPEPRTQTRERITPAAPPSSCANPTPRLLCEITQQQALLHSARKEVGSPRGPVARLPVSLCHPPGGRGTDRVDTRACPRFPQGESQHFTMCAQTGRRKGWVTQTNRLLPRPPGPCSKEGLSGGTLLGGDEFPASGGCALYTCL